MRANRSKQMTPSVFWPTVWLAVALVAIKASYVSLAVFWDWARPSDYLSWLFVRWVAGAAQADLLFALGLGAIAGAIVWVLRGRPVAGRFVARGFVVIGIIGIWYAVISREFFAYAAAPLTYQLLALGGDPRQLSSSLMPFATLPVVAALVAGPVVYVALSRATPRLLWRLPSRGRRWGKGAGVIAVLAWLVTGRQMLATTWFAAQDRYVRESPHWLLAGSFALEATGVRPSLRSVTVRQEDLCQLVTQLDSRRGNDGVADAVIPVERPRNLILIVLESIGTQYLGLYGGSFATTPRLQAERASSLLFDSYYTPVGWTAYSLYSMVLSKRPPLKGYNTSSFTLSGSEEPTLGNILLDRGYATAFMSAGDPDWASKGFFEGRGFSEIVRGADLDEVGKLTSWGVQDRVLFDRMIQWIEAHRREPFFLMAWTDQTHHPYKLGGGQDPFDSLPTGVQDTDGSLRRYLALVREADRQVGRLLDSLRAWGLAEKSLVVITGDHGEAFGGLHHVSGHGFTVYDEEVKVPLIVWNPALFGEGATSHEVGSHVDLSATILDVLGIPAPDQWEGHSLLNRRQSLPVYLFAAGWGESLLGVRDENWKYVFDVRRGKDELYDLSQDPDEQRDMSGTHTERAARLRERLAAWLQVSRGEPGTLAAGCP